MHSYWTRRAGVRQCLDFGMRQAGDEAADKLAAQGQMGASKQQHTDRFPKRQKKDVFFQRPRGG